MTITTTIVIFYENIIRFFWLQFASKNFLNHFFLLYLFLSSPSTTIGFLIPAMMRTSLSSDIELAEGKTINRTEVAILVNVWQTSKSI
jgi:hypothetical protein